MRPTNEFNLTAVPSEEMRRLLYYFEQTGNEALILPHAALTAEAVREKQRREDREFSEFVERVLASRERIEQFHVEITEIDEKRSVLLDRVRAKLRETREELKRLRDAAPEVTLPDGRREKVYRDFDDVRTESGEFVGPEIIKADAVSADRRNFLKTRHTLEKEDRLTEFETRVEGQREQDRNAVARADKGEMSDKDIDKHIVTSKKSLAQDTSDFEKLLREPPGLKERTFQTKAAPTPTFNGAAGGAMSDQGDAPRPDEIKPQGRPAVSTPAPR